LIALLVGLGALVTAIMQGASWGWSAAPTLALLALAAVVLVSFVLIERGNDHALIAIELLRNPLISICNLAIFVGQFSAISVVVFVALYLQDELQVSPLRAGLLLLPAVLPLPFMPIVAGRLADRFGTRGPVSLGLLLCASAFAIMVPAVAWHSYAPLILPLVLWGVSLAFFYVPTRRAIMNAVPAEQRGQASGINMTAQFLGGTTGMAVSGTLLIVTQDFQIVFAVPALLSVVVLAVAWFGIAPEPGQASEPGPPSSGSPAPSSRR
jgi:MFS family permease